MRVNTLHAGFNKLANHGYVGRGNVMSGAQRSTYVAAYNTTECNGFKHEPGYLQKYDMSVFKGYRVPRAVLNEVEDSGKEQQLIVYLFKTYGARDRVVQQGWVVTDCQHKPLITVGDNSTHKSWMVARYMAVALERGYGELDNEG
jgi:hypothetical protein